MREELCLGVVIINHTVNYFVPTQTDVNTPTLVSGTLHIKSEKLILVFSS